MDRLKAELERIRDGHMAPPLTETRTPEEVRQRLNDIVAVDQHVRKSSQGLFGLGLEGEAFQATMKEYAALTMAIDRQDTAELKAYILESGWPKKSVLGEEVAHNAWLIAQHADLDHDFQLDVLVRMEKLLPNEVDASDYAYLYDRVAAGENRPQRFGTQGRCTGPGTWEPLEMEEPDKVDERRAGVGLESMADYKARFTDLCRDDDTAGA